MPQPQILTYYDCMETLQNFAGSSNTPTAQQDLRRVIHEAQRELGDTFGWSFLHKQGRVILRATESTGTVAYNSTSRVLTLTGASWPSWAVDATVRVGDLPCRAQTRTNGTSLVLDSTMNPGQAVASSTTFQIYPTAYNLPHDFVSMVQPWAEEQWRNAQEVDYDRLMVLDRYRDSTGNVQAYCIREVADLHGTYGLYIHPAADAKKTMDFIYQRRPRQLRYTGHDTAERVGIIDVSAAGAVTDGGGSDTTTFTSAMEGSVLRIGTGSTNVPTGLWGLYPYSDERVIASVTDATNLTLDGTTTAQTGVKYCITDPVDIDIGLANALLACIRKRFAIERNMKNKAEFAAVYTEELRLARQNDQRSRQPRVAGTGQWYRRRFADVPLGTDLT